MLRKQFFGEKSAAAFAEHLKEQGCENIQIWGSKDGFGQTIFTVVWERT